MQITLWQFPEADFTDWCELVGAPQVADYREYVTLLASVQADLERLGQTVVRTKFTVAEMRDALSARGLKNTPDNRALITAERA